MCANAGLSSTVRDELLKEARQGQTAFMQRLTEACSAGVDSGVFRSGLAPHLMALAVISVVESCTNLAFRKNDPDVATLVPSAVLAVHRILGVA